MNENDWLRIKHSVMHNTEKQHRFLEGLGNVRLALTSHWAKELAIASDAIAAFQMDLGFKAFLANIEHRTEILKDCVLNTVALETFHAAAIPADAKVATERLALATDFVSEHANVVRRLRPNRERGRRLKREETWRSQRQNKLQKTKVSVVATLSGAQNGIFAKTGT